jgi:hypothetical protein
MNSPAFNQTSITTHIEEAALIRLRLCTACTIAASFNWADPVSRELAQQADAAFADIVDDRIGTCTTRATRTDGSSLLYNTITISGLPFRALNACFTYVPVKGQIYPTFVAEGDPKEPTLSCAVYFSGDLVYAADGTLKLE